MVDGRWQPLRGGGCHIGLLCKRCRTRHEGRRIAVDLLDRPMLLKHGCLLCRLGVRVELQLVGIDLLPFGWCWGVVWGMLRRIGSLLHAGGCLLSLLDVQLRGGWLCRLMLRHARVILMQGWHGLQRCENVLETVVVRLNRIIRGPMASPAWILVERGRGIGNGHAFEPRKIIAGIPRLLRIRLRGLLLCGGHHCPLLLGCCLDESVAPPLRRDGATGKDVTALTPLHEALPPRR